MVDLELYKKKQHLTFCVLQDDESEESSSEEDDDDEQEEEEGETTLDESASDSQFSRSQQVRNGQALNIKDGLNYRSNTAFKTDDETDTEKASSVRHVADAQDPTGVIVFSGNDSDGPGKAAEFLIAQTKQKFLGND